MKLLNFFFQSITRTGGPTVIGECTYEPDSAEVEEYLFEQAEDFEVKVDVEEEKEQIVSASAFIDLPIRVNRLTNRQPLATTTVAEMRFDVFFFPHRSSPLTFCNDRVVSIDWHSDCSTTGRGSNPREEKMIVCFANQCDYCRSSIVPGQRWVREKIYDATLNGRDPSYHRYHAEPFAGQEASCWEKHQMELEIARTRAHAA
jgi:hypothetical protein